MAKVSFDGPEKLILVNSGITSVDVKGELYSEWKRWTQSGDNSKYDKAFTVIGGEPLPGGLYAGSTFFLTNNWKLRSWEGTHELNLLGNIFTDDGSNTFVPTSGDYNVTLRVTASNLAQGIEIPSTVVEVNTQQVDVTTQQVSASGLDPFQSQMLNEIYKILGLLSGAPLVITPTSRSVSGVAQTFVENGDQVTVTRI